MRPTGVHHVAVVVRDLGRAEAFYSGLLGLPVVARHADQAGLPRAVWVDLGGGAFLAVEREDGGGASGPHCLALSIPPSDRAAWATRLESAGFPICKQTSFTIYARDPDGNLVGLSHYPDPA